MSWDNDGQWRSDDRTLSEGGSARQLVVPVLFGQLAGLVVQLVAFTVILAAAFAVSDTGDDFGTGDALVWGTLGAVGLAVATATCAWIIRRTAVTREVGTEKAQRVALFAATIFAALVILLALAPALRLSTLPIYVVLALAGAWLGSGGLPRS